MSNAFASLSEMGTGIIEADPVEKTSFNNKFNQDENPEHTTLSDEAVVFFTVPKKTLRQLENPDGEKYTQIGFRVTGAQGYINAYLYTKNPVQSGDTFNARTLVRSKKMPDGRKYLYLELRPTSDEITHNLAIVTESGIETATGATKIFKGYRPVKGAILLTPKITNIVNFDDERSLSFEWPFLLRDMFILNVYFLP